MASSCSLAVALILALVPLTPTTPSAQTVDGVICRSVYLDTESLERETLQVDKSHLALGLVEEEIDKVMAKLDERFAAISDQLGEQYRAILARRNQARAQVEMAKRRRGHAEMMLDASKRRCEEAKKELGIVE